MADTSDKIREAVRNPVETGRELHRKYGFSKKEFSKILFITSAALLMVSIHVSTTLGSVQQDLKQTDQQVQQASAVITSDSFQNALDTLERVQSQNVNSQLETARQSFAAAEESFQKITEAEQRVGESVRMYQWLALISILGLVSSAALRFM